MIDLDVALPNASSDRQRRLLRRSRSDTTRALRFVLGDLQAHPLRRANGPVSCLAQGGPQDLTQVLGVVFRRDIERPADHLSQLLDRDYVWHLVASLALGMAGGDILHRAESKT